MYNTATKSAEELQTVDRQIVPGGYSMGMKGVGTLYLGGYNAINTISLKTPSNDYTAIFKYGSEAAKNSALKSLLPKDVEKAPWLAKLFESFDAEKHR